MLTLPVKKIFEKVGMLFEHTHKIARSQVFDSLFARENLGSTGLGCGVAIPHGHIKDLKMRLLRLLKLKN